MGAQERLKVEDVFIQYFLHRLSANGRMGTDKPATTLRQILEEQLRFENSQLETRVNGNKTIEYVFDRLKENGKYKDDATADDVVMRYIGEVGDLKLGLSPEDAKKHNFVFSADNKYWAEYDRIQKSYRTKTTAVSASNERCDPLSRKSIQYY